MKKKIIKQPSKHTLFEFVDVIPWENIEKRMNKREYKKFLKFMEGQTCGLVDGKASVYKGDLVRFLLDVNDNVLYD